MATASLISEKGLPASIDAERFILSAILLDDSQLIGVGATLSPDDFSIEKHRLIFARMLDLAERNERIDRLTLANELLRRGQLEAVDGLSYLVALDDGLPPVFNLDSYIRLVKDKSTLRRIIFTAQSLIDRAMRGEEQADELLSNAEESLLKLGESRLDKGLVDPGRVIDEYEGGLNAFLDPSKRIRGLSTGYLKFDEKTGGMHEGELLILAARPAMGKTALALNIASHVAIKLRKTVAIFSLEMSKESLLTRILCSLARVDSQKFRAGYLNAEERRRLQMHASDLVEAPLYLDDTASISLMDIHAKLRRLQAEKGLALAVVDYLQLMSGRGRFENRVQEVSALSRGLKLMAKELRIPILVLSQLSRAPETRQGDHRPQLSDLRESGSIEQDADVVSFIFREEVYKPDREDLRGEAELLVAKQRSGPTGKVKLVFLHEFTKFENFTSDLPEEGEFGE
jgi:replicative DNA helicase